MSSEVLALLGEMVQVLVRVAFAAVDLPEQEQARALVLVRVILAVAVLME